MTEPSKETARIQSLLTTLGLLLIFTLLLLVVLAVYPYIIAPPNSVATAQARSIQPTRSTTPSPSSTLSPSPTRTLRDTFTPTISPTPSRTPTLTLSPTPPGPPTLTPARPVRGEANYILQDWSPERADYMIALMEDYPNTLPRQSRGENDENYYAAYEFAVIAQREALLRFPDAPQADQWRWGLAYNLARLGDLQAGKHYASLIEQALNRGQAELDGLLEWLQRREPRLKFTSADIPAIPGYLSSLLIEAQGKGSAYILVLETQSAYQAIVLSNGFDFINQPVYSFLSGDLTGDGVNEVVILKQPLPGEFMLPAPKVFNLAENPPSELPFNPNSTNLNIGTDNESHWELVNSSQGKKNLTFTAQMFPACPASLSITYDWDGSEFNSEGPAYGVEPAPGTLSYCRYVVEHASNVWGPAGTISIMESLLPFWPPEQDENGTPFPEDESDHWRYLLAINYALAGNYELASSYFEQIISQPATATSEWIAPAQQFLANYQQGNSLYLACVASDYCQPAVAMQFLVENTSPGDYPVILSNLWQQGVSQRSSGYFDFDGDGRGETWLTVRHRSGEQLELWILIPYKEGVKAFNLGGIDSTLPHITYYDESSLPPVVLISDIQAFQVNRLPDSLEPYLTPVELPKFYPDRFKEGLEAQIEALFSGENQASVAQALHSLEENPGLLCRGTWSCDRYYYTLGLSAELAKDRSTAIKTYLQLWWDYSRSPYSTMARLKLVSKYVPPTGTPSPTQTGTPVLTATPTVSGTPPTSTITPTITNTTTGYPGPSPFPTSTNAYP
ncbi:MAG TPA: hypothetical protein VLA49_22235 [Anaerolineales bacterium]|nr:hypothetical protein [Anaerolineales bacterium]